MKSSPQMTDSDESESLCNAVIYARYSSHRQNEASIEQQIEVCRKYADDNNIRVVAVYSDHALTGTTDRRPEFLRMIKDSAKEKWKRVLVYKIDRFARNRYDSATYKSKLKKHGVSVTSVMEPIPEGPEGILLESILEGSAEYYSANLAQNVKRGMYDNAKSCKVNNGVLPLGYKKSANGLYEIDPPGAQTVKQIFAMYGDGVAASVIVQTLNAEGRKTSVGNKFTINSLHSILKNERYTGVYIWGNVRVEDGIPAIVTKEEFERVQQKIKKRAQAPASSRSEDDYILTGKLFCGYCGKPMVGESGVGKSGRKYCYYKCIGQKRGTGCKKKPLRKDFIENYIIANTREKCLSDSAISLIVDAALKLQDEDLKSGNLAAYQKELADTERSIKNMVAAIEQGIITPSTKNRLNELEDQKKDLEILIAKEQIQKPQLTGQQLRFWMERFRKGSPSDPAYQKTFVDMFISAVYVFDDHLKIIVCYNNTPTEVIANLVSDPDAKPHFEFGFDGYWTAMTEHLSGYDSYPDRCSILYIFIILRLKIMTYFLTSSPCVQRLPKLNPANGFVEELRKTVRQPSTVLFICSDPDDPMHTDMFSDFVTDSFAESGFEFASLEVLDRRNADRSAALIEKADLIILAGGHVPTQNRFFQEIHLRELLQNYDGVLIGISAGTMNSADVVYAQPELDGEAVSKDYKRFLPGLGITRIMVLPHYQATKDYMLDGLRLFEDITYPDSVGGRFYALVDGSYILGIDGREELRGEAYLIRDGNIEKVCRENESVLLS